MSKETNLMGLNLSVDNELIAEAAREAIVASVAESLNMKDRLVQEFVKSMLTERVRVDDGKPSQYHGDRCCSRMEWYVRKAIQEATKEEIINMIEAQKPVIAEMVRKEFMSRNTQSQFVEMFMDALAGTFRNNYRAKVNVEFERDPEY